MPSGTIYSCINMVPLFLYVLTPDLQVYACMEVAQASLLASCC